MIRNKSWFTRLVSPLLKSAGRRVIQSSDRRESNRLLAGEVLEPRHLLTADLNLSGHQLVDLTIPSLSNAGANSLPQLMPSQFFVEHGAAASTLVGTIRGTDADGETLSYAIVSQPNGDGDANEPFIIANTNQLVLQDAGDLGDGSQLSTIDVDVRISDPHGHTDVTLEVVIIPQDTGPTFADVAVTVDEDLPKDATVDTLTATYADGSTCGAVFLAVDNVSPNTTNTGFVEGSTIDSASPRPLSYHKTESMLNRNEVGAFTWNATDLGPGTYTVSTTWAPRYNRNPSATYEVHGHDGQVLASKTFAQNHDPTGKTSDGQVWAEIGEVVISDDQAADSLSVTLDVSTGLKKFTVADAVLFEANPFEIVTNYDADGDQNYAFALSDDPDNLNQIIVNDTGDIDYESNPSIKLLVKADVGQNAKSYALVTIDLNKVPVKRDASDWSDVSGWGTLNIPDIIEAATGTRPSEAELFGDGFGVKHWNVNSVRAPDAWQAGYTGEDVVVAVIDNGVDYTHPDLQDNIWINQSEVPSSLFASVDTSGDTKVSANEVIAYMHSTGGGDLNSDGAVDLVDAIHSTSPFMDGVDSSHDVNTQIDDLFGWNFKQINYKTHSYGTNNPAHQWKRSGAAGKEQFHGTHIAGTIAGTGTGTTGVRGIAPGAQIMPVVALAAENFGCSEVDIYKSVRYAVDSGADVINLSIYWANNNYRTRTMAMLNAAIEYATSHGVFIAICSGNNGDSSPDKPGLVINTTGGVTVGASAQFGSGGDFDGNDIFNIADLVAPTSVLIDGHDHDGISFGGNVDNLINQSILTASTVSTMDFNSDSYVSAAEIKQYFTDQQRDLNGDQLYDLADAILDTSLFVGGSAELLFNQSEIPYWLFHTEFDRDGDGQFTTPELENLVVEWADYKNPSFNNKSGSTSMHYLTAPGVKVYSAKPGGGYVQKNGTSMATPHVAGAAALLLSAKDDWSQQWSFKQIEKIVALTADAHRYDGDGTDGGGSGNTYDSPVQANANIENHSGPVFSNQIADPHDEHSGSGGSIEDLDAFDADGNTLTYLLVDSTVPDVDGDGVPALVIQGNQIIVNDPDDLDHEHHGDSFDVTAVVFDGTHSETATITIQLNDINEIPVVNTPAAHVGILDTALVFENSGDNYLHIADADDEEVLTELRLLIENQQGSMLLDNADTESLALFTGNGTADVTLRGTVAEINQALHGMSLSHIPGVTEFDLEFRISQDAGQSEVVTVVPVSFVEDVTIIDNDDAGFSQVGFTYQSNSHVSSAYNGDNYSLRNGGVDDLASWNFGDLEDGTYHVMATWAHKYNNQYNAVAAPFQMLDAGGNVLSSVSVNQRIAPDQHAISGSLWNTLDTVYVAGGQLTITLGPSVTENMYSVADAICIEQLEQLTPTLVVQLAESSVSENTGTVSGIVSRGAETSGDLVVALDSDDTSAGTVPSTVTIADGSGSAAFTLTVVDNGAIDGDKSIGISATASGFVAGAASLEVVDDDATILYLDNGSDGFTADPSFKSRPLGAAYGSDIHYQRGGGGEATWTFTGLAEGEYLVAATWANKYDNKYNSEKVPFSVTNGSDNLLSTLTVDQTLSPDDFSDGGYGWKNLDPVYIDDGTLVVTMGAAPTNHYAVADAIRIELNESFTPSLFVLVDNESESAGSASGTVVRTGDTSSEAVVSLSSSNPAAATVESSITFAIGESSKSFTITPTDDSSPDGIQQSTVEATATGYTTGTAVLNVEDDDALEVAIIDNTDSGYTSNGFRQNRNKHLSNAYGGNNEILMAGQPGAEARWVFAGLADGVYHVAATWNNQYDNKYNTSDAVYTISDAADQALAATTVNQSNAPAEFLDSGISWGTLDTVTVTGGELVVTLTGGNSPNRRTVADAVRIARVAQLGGSSLRMAEGDLVYDPLEDTLDDLASEWSDSSDGEDHLIWGE